MISQKVGKAVTPAQAVRLRRTKLLELTGFPLSRNDENGIKRIFYEPVKSHFLQIHNPLACFLRFIESLC